MLQQWEMAQQQVEMSLQQWGMIQQQAEKLLQQWDIAQQQAHKVLQQWEGAQLQVRLIPQQLVSRQQQVVRVLQQWDSGTTASRRLASTAMGWRHNSKWRFFYSNGRKHRQQVESSSTATGAYGTTASDYGSLVIGQYNSSGSSVTNSATSFSTANTAFVIGNGADSSNKSDAFKVMFNGDTTVSNDLTVSGDVVVSSDARLKSNIVSLGSTLSRLLLIDGKSYEMKGKQKIGVLAQDIKEVFPELVTEDDNEMLAVNYQGLVSCAYQCT